ncbi:MAG TPA: hypothetical protein VNS88_13375, partial [Nitrospiraceae bacterium]|nr:hypothetical protein [Nitrospiraceae bacterium]
TIDTTLIEPDAAELADPTQDNRAIAPIVPLATDEAEDEPAIIKVCVIAPVAELAAEAEPTITPVLLIEPLAADAFGDVPETPSIWAIVPFASRVFASAWPDTLNVVPVGTDGKTGMPGPRQVFPVRLI